MDLLNKKGIAAVEHLREEVLSLRQSIDALRNQQERHYQEHKAEQSSRDHGQTRVSGEINAEIHETEATERQSRSRHNRNFWVQVLLTLGTWLAFGAAAYYAGIAKGQLKQFKRQIAMDQRAWLMIDPGYSDQQIRLTPQDTLKVPIKLQNIGKTAAKNIRGFIIVEESSSKEANSYLPSDAKPHNGIKDAIIYPPLAHTTDVTEFEQSKPVLAKSAQVEDFKSGKLVFMIHGRITYEDIFHVSHWFTFCHPVSKFPIARSEKCVKYNDIDEEGE